MWSAGVVWAESWVVLGLIVDGRACGWSGGLVWMGTCVSMTGLGVGGGCGGMESVNGGSGWGVCGRVVGGRRK